ncbi:MAG: glycosyltransferase family 2 protein [Bdellovibrionales bacterium]
MPRVIAVVVTYNPDDGFPARAAEHAAEVERLIIVDNSTVAHAAAILDSLGSRLSNYELIRNGGNLGLAKAQNIGIRRALELGAEWVMLLDDDSKITSGMIAAMFAALASYPEAARVGLLAPRVVDERSGLESKVIVSRGAFDIRRVRFGNSPWIDTALTAIASGSLIRSEALAACGMMREAYFIDGIDIEYCLRLRRHGWRLLMAREACLRHRLGAKTTHRVAGVAFVASNHSVLRRYTIMRNRVDIWKRYARQFPAYVGYDALVSVFETVKILLFEAQRFEKIQAAFLGFCDGLRGAFPPLVEALGRSKGR